MNFKELGVSQEYIKALEQMGITEPSLCQEQSFKPLMDGRDIMMRSKTGSGKTVAFLLPILEKMDHKSSALQAIILTPTRELAEQIFNEIRKLSRHTKALTIYGGVSLDNQTEKLRKWAQIAVCTPGRLLDHIERRTIILDSVRFAVIDEADRMFDMGFIDDVTAIMAKFPLERQTMLFSATMPEAVKKLSERFMNAPENFMLEQDEITVDKIRQHVLGLGQRDKLPTLIRILKRKDVKRAMVFVNTKMWATKLGEILQRRRFPVLAIHSGLSQNRRNHVMEDFKKGKVQVLICTDVAARGLHIDGVTHVFNYDLPKNPKDYIHRIGRTGRAGEEGDAISFMTTPDEPLLRNIEREIQQYLTVDMPGGETQKRDQFDLSTVAEDTGMGGPYTKSIKQGMKSQENIQQTSTAVGTSDWDNWD